MKRDIYICTDDSGKLNRNEKWTVYGGMVFLSQIERNSFIRKYQSVIEEIKCSYCEEDPYGCLKMCPEVKSSNPLKGEHRRRLMNMIKKEYTYVCLINNNKVYDHIMNSKAGRGRYSDYAIKMFVKRIIQDLLYKGSLNRNDDITLHLYFDEQPTTTNGYYSLEESIKEELLHGVSNYQYNMTFRPILGGSLEIDLKYFDSKYHYDIQACDVLAGTIRHIIIRESMKYSERIKQIAEKTTIQLYLP